MINYLVQGTGYLSYAIKYGTIFFLLLFIIKFKKNNDYTKLLLSYMFILYIFTVLGITGLISNSKWQLNKNIFISLTFEDIFSMEKLMNVLMFIPLGFFLPCFLKEKKKIIYILIVFISSISIELLQCFFIGRIADITDIIVNTLGGILGTIIYYFTKKIIFLFNIQNKKSHLVIISCFINSILIILSLPLINKRMCLGDIIISRLFSYKLTWYKHDLTCMNFSGIHYTLIYFIIIEIISWRLIIKYDDTTINKNKYTPFGLTLLYLFTLFIFQII